MSAQLMDRRNLAPGISFDQHRSTHRSNATWGVERLSAVGRQADPADQVARLHLQDAGERQQVGDLLHGPLAAFELAHP
jgi:hypothetical protein